MTEEIDGYKEDLERQIATLQDGLSKLSRAKEDRKANLIAGMETALADAKASYGSFLTAFREIDKTLQPKYQPLGQQFNQELKQITEQLKGHKNAQERASMGLADDQRTTEEILDEAKQIQAKSKESTTRSKAIVKDIIEVGTATHEQLVQDRQKLETVHADLEEMDSDLKIAQNQLKAIARKLTKDKIIRGLCIIACLIILVAIIIVIVKRDKSKGGKTNTG